MFMLKKKRKSIEVESYKTLRTNIQYSSEETLVKTILITSSGAGEGKTTIAVNLAKTFAENGQSVAIVDCNLRNPHIHEVFNFNNLRGISDVVKGSEKLENVIQQYSEKIYVIPAGKKQENPSEIIGSVEMKNLIESLKNKYEIIILDSPPVGNVTDGQILSTEVDGTIVVVKAEETKSKKFIESIDLLKKVNANIIGVILNNVKINTI